MTKHDSRITEKQQREYMGEESAGTLMHWLNATSNLDGKKRIINVIDLFTKLHAHQSEAECNLLDQKPEDQKKRGELTDALNAALSYYRMTPQITVLRYGGELRELWLRMYGHEKGVYVGTSWVPIPGSKLAHDESRTLESLIGDEGRSARQRPLPGTRTSEIEAIKATLELIESGLIFKVLPCRCGKFFFQKFPHQRFCSQKCRIAAFRDSDEARLERNAYARKLYHRKKDLEEGKRR